MGDRPANEASKLSFTRDNGVWYIIQFVRIDHVICPASIEDKMGAFWDEHDFTEFDDPDAPDVEFEIMLSVAIDPDLLAGVEKQARLRGVSVETLVNLWLQQKLLEATPA